MKKFALVRDSPAGERPGLSGDDRLEARSGRGRGAKAQGSVRSGAQQCLAAHGADLVQPLLERIGVERAGNGQVAHT